MPGEVRYGKEAVCENIQTGNAGGLTPLLGRDGKPVVTTILEEE